MRQRGQKASGREALIASGIAWRLTDAPDNAFRETIATQFANLHNGILALSNQRDAAASSERIELRNRILSQGLPGDPVVNQMWIESNNARTGVDGQ
jgi:hypothetical protein